MALQALLIVGPYIPGIIRYLVHRAYLVLMDPMEQSTRYQVQVPGLFQYTVEPYQQSYHHPRWVF